MTVFALRSTHTAEVQYTFSRLQNFGLIGAQQPRLMKSSKCYGIRAWLSYSWTSFSFLNQFKYHYNALRYLFVTKPVKQRALKNFQEAFPPLLPSGSKTRSASNKKQPPRAPAVLTATTQLIPRFQGPLSPPHLKPSELCTSLQWVLHSQESSNRVVPWVHGTSPVALRMAPGPQSSRTCFTEPPQSGSLASCGVRKKQ